MKPLLFLLFCLSLCGRCCAQLSVYKQVSLPADPGAAERSLAFGRLAPDQFFFANKKVKRNAWAFSRAKWAMDHVKPTAVWPGLRHSSASGDSTVCRFAVGYQSVLGGCIQFLTVYGDMIIRNATDSTRISFADIRYIHTNIDAPPTTTQINGGVCGATGSINELIDCAVCRSAIGNILALLNTSLEALIEKYKNASPAAR